MYFLFKLYIASRKKWQPFFTYLLDIFRSESSEKAVLIIFSKRFMWLMWSGGLFYDMQFKMSDKNRWLLRANLFSSIMYSIIIYAYLSLRFLFSLLFAAWMRAILRANIFFSIMYSIIIYAYLSLRFYLLFYLLLGWELSGTFSSRCESLTHTILCRKPPWIFHPK